MKYIHFSYRKLPARFVEKMIQTKATTLSYANRSFTIEYFQRHGTRDTLLFLHGLGGAKENFWWATRHSALEGYNLISFDNPGTGNSSYFPELRLGIDDLVEITAMFIDRLISENFYLAGASMGGLTMLNYLKRHGKERVLGLINIEGNLAMEDCLFSSKVMQYSFDEFISHGFQSGINEMRKNPSCGYQTVAHNIALNTNPASYYGYSFQTVDYSSSRGLLDSFISLDLPKIFFHGDKNGHLSYIPQLKDSGVSVKQISNSDHFLFYDNPGELYQHVAEFICKQRL